MPHQPPSRAPLLDNDVLRSFVAIAESGSFTRAAQQVFRTPSALSMQIKGLEKTLGHALFVREARQVRLTAHGEILLGYGRRLLKLNEEAIARFLAPPLSGTVRLGSPDDVSTRILPEVLMRFAQSHPAVQVDVVAGRSVELAERLRHGELHLALVTLGMDDVDGSQAQVVHSEPLVWAGRRAGAARHRSPLPLSLASHGCAWRRMALDALDGAGIEYRVAYSSEHCAGQEAAMLADLAVAPFPASLVQAPLTALGPDAGLPPLGHYQIGLLRHHAEPASEELARHIVEAFRNLPSRVAAG
ncbi:LysR substrate-binding domain-containing protein [Alloalcanivorax mobilis]|uniref:LysR substrate-binding domain-containing protein n=1 Tax=Alloalcanivorax mobilis TaxID=2019569 RepID=UPI000B5B1645|nr:LysR substrate-binding domain-containing protein [Alloalcanivorax mobilis]ASK34317.1 LysR family transcriptional regulator [Alcanivorax sp. N3-2A]|tara:strand:- start:126168 stop:127070 length:903 start_codon:yes stop_codon:yes gene_type:complete